MPKQCASLAVRLQVVESCAVMLGALSQQRLLSIVARLLREVSDSPGTGDTPRLRSDSPSARQEIFQICRGMKHVRLPLGNGAQVRCG
jgi:Cell morphogenesis N-terminal